MVKSPAFAGVFLFYGMVIYIIKNRHSGGGRNPVLHFAKLVSLALLHRLTDGQLDTAPRRYDARSAV
ncbi:MAG: hypothetical protein MJ164_02455 [Alphaproteobacteria bacterium]|nr:hypothetical protein [Alphaproteobacteria bacterium]